MKEPNRKAVIVSPEEMVARPMSRPGARSFRMVDETVGAVAVDLHLNILEPGGGSGPYHLHTNAENVYYVLEGTLEVRIGDETLRLGPRGVVFIPPGVPHEVTNVGKGEAHLLEIYAPPGPDFVPVEDGGGALTMQPDGEN